MMDLCSFIRLIKNTNQYPKLYKLVNVNTQIPCFDKFKKNTSFKSKISFEKNTINL